MPSKLLSNLEIFSQAISVNPARSQNPTFQALFLGSYWRTGYVLCNNNVNGEHKIMKSRRISNTGNSRGSWNPAQHTQSQGQQKMESRWDAAKRRDTKQQIFTSLCWEFTSAEEFGHDLLIRTQKTKQTRRDGH